MSSRSTSSSKSHESKWEDRLFDVFVTFGKLLFLISSEIGKGMYRGTFPYVKAGIALGILYFTLRGHYENYLFHFLGIGSWYPTHPILYRMYYYFWQFSPLWGWGLIQVIRTQRLKNRVGLATESIGLKNGIGKTPLPIFDHENRDGTTRTLRLKRAGLPIQEFQKQKAALEGAMNIYVDDIREDRNRGTVDIRLLQRTIDRVLPASESQWAFSHAVYGGNDAVEHPPRGF